MKIFDVHIHYPRLALLDTSANPEQIVADIAAQCETAGIWRACLLGVPGRGNEIVRDAIRRHAPLFLGMAMLALDATTPDDVRRLKDDGFTGLKLIRPRHAYDDPAYWPIYETAQRLCMPILFHTGVQGGVIDFLESELPAEGDPAWAQNAYLEATQAGIGLSSMKMHPGLLDTLGFTFPELRMIGAHLGYGWYDIACAVARWRRNVYFDISGGTVVRRHIIERQLIGREIQPHKLVFGSDCRTGQIMGEVSAWQAEFARMGLSQEDQEKIWWRNAAHIFDIEP